MQNGTYIHLVQMPNSTNSILEYNIYTGGIDDDYIKKYEIVSEKERKMILKHWDKIQYENEIQFQKDYMASVSRMCKNEESEEEEYD